MSLTICPFCLTEQKCTYEKENDEKEKNKTTLKFYCTTCDKKMSFRHNTEDDIANWSDTQKTNAKKEMEKMSQNQVAMFDRTSPVINKRTGEREILLTKVTK